MPFRERVLQMFVLAFSYGFLAVVVLLPFYVVLRDGWKAIPAVAPFAIVVVSAIAISFYIERVMALRKKRNAPNPTTCPECDYPRPNGSDSCPECGYSYVPKKYRHSEQKR